MSAAARRALALRYDHKARLALAASVLLAVLAAAAALQGAFAFVAQAQADLDLARTAIAAVDLAGRSDLEAARTEQILPGRSLADVQGAAQAQLKALAERSGAGIASLQVTAGEGPADFAPGATSGLVPLRLRTVLSVPERRLAALLADLATSRPLLAPEAFEIEPESGGRGAPTGAPSGAASAGDAMLAMRLEIVGFARLGPGGRP